jgi:hypothetical protein
VNTCGECGDWLCEECTAEVGGRHFCIPCLQKKWSQEHAPHGHVHSHQAHDVPPRPIYPPYAPYPHKRVNAGLLFIFSFLPGLNYMYEGLIKRGLFIMVSFFMSSYLTAIFEEPFFGIAITVIWFASFFDGYRIRRLIEAGVEVPDNVDDITGFIKEHKMIIILFAIALLGFAFVGNLGSMFFNGYYVNRAFRAIIPLGILLFALYMIVVSGKKKSISSTIDHRVPPQDNDADNN